MINKSKEEVSLLPLWDKAVSNLENVDLLYKEGTVEEQRLIVGSMFPEKLTFNGTQHRTTRVNEAAALTSLIGSKLESIKKGASVDFSNLSLEVIPLGLYFEGLMPLFINKLRR